jgi:hypothetical protein
MHSLRFVNNWLERKCSFVHRARARSLGRAVEALLGGGKLSLTHLGRSLSGPSYEKHRIKSVDRLLGNRHLHGERLEVYRRLAHELLRGSQRPVIVVDWSDGHPGRKWLLLRAAVAVQGRALTVYEEAHPKAVLGNPKVQREFLDALETVLPAHCCPIVVTDAGFRGPWFRQVQARGWEWVGRIRGRVYCRPHATGKWVRASTLHRRARAKAQRFSDSVLYQNRPLDCDLYLVKKYRRLRGRPHKRSGLGALARTCRRTYAEPWLLAASDGLRDIEVEQLVAVYAKRMTIEESFRDLKSHRWGFAARYARSASMERIQVLLLIATLAAFVSWVVGVAAKARRWAANVQANTERRREVLSTGFLGWRVLQRPDIRLTQRTLRQAYTQLQALVAHYGCPA